jgi:hypothetical protein
MNIQKKIRVIDSVFFTDEIDYLLFRFTELNDSVDLFVILEPLVDFNGSPRISEFEKNIDKFDFWKEKIIHIKTEIPSDYEMDEIFSIHKLKNLNIINNFRDNLEVKQLYNLKLKLNSLELSFDDIIMVSNIDEFPVVPPTDVLHTYLSFEPIFFSQKDFIWSKDFCKPENHIGTLCFSYSHLVTSDLMFTLLLAKSHNSKLNVTTINFGYRFFYFNSIQESVRKISQKYNQDNLEWIENLINNSRNNLLYYDMSTESKPKPLKKYFGDLPINIHMLNSQSIGRIEPKKYLIIINSDVEPVYCDGTFDSVFIIKPTDKLSSKNTIKISDKIETHFIIIPKKKYYDILIRKNTLENFQEMYFLNEIKKIIIFQFPLDIDTFEFNYKGNSSKYNWSEIKNSFIYDLLYK